MSFLAWLIVGALATARLASLVARERGLFAVMSRLRTCFGVHHLPDGTPEWADGELLLDPVTPWARVDDLLHEVALGLTCTWCCSLWIALAVVGLALVASGVFYVLLVFALSEAAILIDRNVTG